jgi:hypothetical protein
MRRFLKACVLAFGLTVAAVPAWAACSGQTVTISLAPAGLSATKCLSTSDLASLESALASPLIADGTPSPTPMQEWTEAINIMAGSLNSFATLYLQGQAELQAPAVTFLGMQ